MKTQTLKVIAGLFLFLSACKKDNDENNQSGGQAITYSSLSDFYSRNGVVLQEYTIDAQSGGTFTTPQGTTVTIPPVAFRTLSGGNVTGNVTIQFKDIYKTSDMLLSKRPTNTLAGPLKSGGEFFIKAIQNDQPLQLDSAAIVIEQPVANTAGFDSADVGMQPFAGIQDVDSAGVAGNFFWQPWPNCDLVAQASAYIFTMYQFNNPEDSGTWCNSDNPTYFSSFTPTALTLHPLNSDATTDVFLIFQGRNSMVHVYHNFNDSNYTYSYAPLGLTCTAVAVSVKQGKLYSSFVPITISNNSTVDFTLTETTSDDFKETLRSFD